MIPGQVALRPHGFAAVPVVNVENACAGGATALWLAIAHVRAGLSDVALAVGVDKLVCADPAQGLAVFDGAMDIAHREETLAALAALTDPLPPEWSVDGDRSVFTEIYASLARAHMQRFGTTEAHLAAVSAKNHAHSVHNPRAHFRRAFTAQEILAARRVAWPLTVPMCSPVSDGAAAVVVTRADFTRDESAVAVLSSVLLSGTDRAADDAGRHIGRRAALAAYEKAGIGPQDVDVAEVHDATAFGEIQQVENLGFCPIGDGGPWSASGSRRARWHRSGEPVRRTRIARPPGFRHRTGAGLRTGHAAARPGGRAPGPRRAHRHRRERRRPLRNRGGGGRRDHPGEDPMTPGYADLILSALRRMARAHRLPLHRRRRDKAHLDLQ